MSKSFGVSIQDEIADKVEEQLEYGDSRSKWIEQSVDLRLRVDDVIDEYPIEFESKDDKLRFVESAVRQQLAEEYA